MNRRGFIGALLGAAVIDPERLLFVPGRKVYSLPPKRIHEITDAEMERFVELYIRPAALELANEIDRQVVEYYKFGCSVGTGLFSQMIEHRVFVAS